MTEGFNIQRDEKTDSRHNLTWHMMEINRQKREKQMQQMVDRINEQDADLVVIAGDIFDNEWEAVEAPETIAATLRSIRSKYGV